MGHATACMDLPCEWAQFLCMCAERGLEDSALILIATWHRQGPAMTQQFNVNHGHPDGDLSTSFLAYGVMSSRRMTWLVSDYRLDLMLLEHGRLRLPHISSTVR